MAKNSRGKDNIYGETPFVVLQAIGEKTGLGKTARYLELGSGRGKGVFFMRTWFGCSATGIEWVKPFVVRALGVQKLFGFDKVTFLYGDSKTYPFKNADVVYVYSTCFSDEEMQELAVQCASLPKGAYIVTVSAFLHTQCPYLEHVTHFWGKYPWGKAPVYIQKKID